VKIFVIVGMPAAGKNIARIYAESKEIPYFATGDIVRRAVQDRGFEADAKNSALISNELRGDDGMGVTRIALSLALKAGSPIVFMEGMRSWPEIELIRQDATSVVVVAFVAPRETRLSRIVSRGRADDSIDGFAERDLREIAYGASVPISLADEYILNNKTMGHALHALDSIVIE